MSTGFMITNGTAASVLGFGSVVGDVVVSTTTESGTRSVTNSDTSSTHSHHHNNCSEDDGMFADMGSDPDGRGARNIPLVNQPIQSLVLIVILMLALVTNGSVILNISRDSLKLRMVHFLLIRHVCITDSVGALFVLPVPLVSFIKGYWDWSSTACTVISTTTACCWTMHLVAVALYRADRVFAVWLPTGRYPVISPRVVNFLLVLVWATALGGSYLATYTFTPTFQPALALCIPNVPLVFFIMVFTCYCIGLVTLTTGYVFAFVRRRRKKRKRAQQPAVPDLTVKRSSQADCCNNNRLVLMMMEEETGGDEEMRGGGGSSSTGKPPRAVVFNEQHTTASTPTPTTSQNSVTVDNDVRHRPLTPPFIAARVHTHRRVHSDDPCIHHQMVTTTSSHESVVSVQYRSLSSKHESSDEGVDVAAEESVAERLDECDMSGVISSSAASEKQQESIEAGRGGRGGGGVANTAVPLGRRQRRGKARCRVLASYGVSIGHLILYLPAMLVVGVLGANLPPAVAFLCGIVVYCEFIVQPIALLLVSPKLRGEVLTQVRSVLCRRTNSNRGGSDETSATTGTTTILAPAAAIEGTDQAAAHNHACSNDNGDEEKQNNSI